MMLYVSSYRDNGRRRNRLQQSCTVRIHLRRWEFTQIFDDTTVRATRTFLLHEDCFPHRKRYDFSSSHLK
jgi:hypothetical protein